MDWRRWKQESKAGPPRGRARQSGAQPRGCPAGPSEREEPSPSAPCPGAALTAASRPAALVPGPPATLP